MVVKVNFDMNVQRFFSLPDNDSSFYLLLCDIVGSLVVIAKCLLLCHLTCANCSLGFKVLNQCYIVSLVNL